MNYSKVASDSEINKETIRRYMEILSDTLLIETIPSYKEVDKNRRARQKEKFIFFDMGVRNTILGRQKPGSFSREEFGHLFEQWIILQVLYFIRLHNKTWKYSTYRDAMGIEVDLILETENTIIGIEIKSTKTVKEKMFKGLNKFENISKRTLEKIVIYQGQYEQDFEQSGKAVPYQKFLESILPNL